MDIRFYVFVFCTHNVYGKRGWNYVNLHCRDNYDVPIDWWFIYKPPSEDLPFLGHGRNFTFITSSEFGRWNPYHMNINSHTLLRNTLAPVFKRTYRDHLAVAIYDAQKADSLGSSAHGILMADGVGGVWVEHTVPDLINFERGRPLFPDDESPNGHSFVCMSVDLKTINQIAKYLKHTSPYIKHFRVPKHLVHLLPEWDFHTPIMTSIPEKPLKFTTEDNTLKAELLVKSPEDKRCLYTSFAQSKGIFLDVYGQTDSDYLTTICGKRYGIRNIENISLKLPERVLYFYNMTERMRFAVSTAAHWQRLGSGPIQYWTCLSNLDKEDKSGMAGHLLCFNSYEVWVTFDNLKIKEPQC